MTDLIEFLRARLAQTEQLAQAAAAAQDGIDAGWVMCVLYDPVTGSKVAGRNPSPRAAFVAIECDPERMLAEVEAKRRIIDAHVSGDALCDRCAGSPEDCPTLQLLALPYADHPDYRDEWRA